MQTLESVALAVKVFVKLCPKPLLSKPLYHDLRGLMVGFHFLSKGYQF